MAENNHKVAITVALIGVAGSLGAALLANWDKVFGRAAPGGATTVVAVPPSATHPATSPATTPATTAATTSATTAATTSAAPAPGAAPPAPAAARSVADLTGQWRDSTGPNNRSRVTQLGPSFRFSRQGSLPNGTVFEAAGSGTLDGRRLVSSYQARYGNGEVSSGSCSGSVSADGMRMELQCVDSLLGSFASTALRE